MKISTVNLRMKEKGAQFHSNTWNQVALNKVRRIGIDATVMELRNRIKYYKQCPLYQNSWLIITITEWQLEYVVNDLG